VAGDENHRHVEIVSPHGSDQIDALICGMEMSLRMTSNEPVPIAPSACETFEHAVTS